MNAIHLAIDALLAEQKEREEIIQRLMQLAGAIATNGHVSKRKPRDQKKTFTDKPPIKNVKAGGPTTKIWTLLKERGPMTQGQLVAAGVARNTINGALTTLRRRKLLTRSGTARKYVYTLVGK